jgi:uncharacterized protein (TIGR00369 family)
LHPTPSIRPDSSPAVRDRFFSGRAVSEDIVTREGYFWDVMQGRKAPPPAAELLGFKLLDVQLEVGRIRVQFNAKPEFTNPVGDIQGGFLAAMLDDTLGPALVATLDEEQFAPTLELKVNFISPARPGILIGDGRVVSRGRSIAFLAGELTTQGGELVATASATARIVSRRQS